LDEIVDKIGDFRRTKMTFWARYFSYP